MLLRRLDARLVTHTVLSNLMARPLLLSVVVAAEVSRGWESLRPRRHTVTTPQRHSAQRVVGEVLSLTQPLPLRLALAAVAAMAVPAAFFPWL